MVKLKWWEKYIEKICAEVAKNLSKCRFENNFVESSKKKDYAGCSIAWMSKLFVAFESCLKFLHNIDSPTKLFSNLYLLQLN